MRERTDGNETDAALEAQHGAALAPEHVDAVLASADRIAIWAGAPYPPREALELAAVEPCAGQIQFVFPTTRHASARRAEV